MLFNKENVIWWVMFFLILMCWKDLSERKNSSNLCDCERYLQKKKKLGGLLHESSK